MATKMELVLSPGNLGGEGDAGGPFRNEDVREWSRVDRVTGMLERARVETGRWRADTREARQSYGKMTDSRERNSADGNLVQKARRQVEIFQSQGNSGRSFQVVRASQWSSSRATDCGFDIPITNKPSNTHFEDALSNGGGASLLSPRLNSLWRASLANGASDLDRLSCLCRKLHNEALNTTNHLWSLRNAALRSPSPLSPLEDSPPSPTRFQEIEAGLDLSLEDGLSSSGSLGERRSNSTEDVSSLLNTDDAFARDCRTRRSLQIPNSEHNRVNPHSSDSERGRRTRQDLIAERARRFEEGVRKVNESAGVKRNFISTKTFTPIANNDFVRNDPNHPSKFNQVAKISIQDNGQQNSQATVHVASPVLSRASSRFEQPCSSATAIGTRKANNKTVVHLRNAASPTQSENSEPPRCINVTAIKLENDRSHSEPSNESALYSMLMDTSSAGLPSKEESTTLTQVANGAKPVKKVEFCKTEIHFAADSGKVNIVETDGKPPPTNKFRRRRRNNSIGAANNTQQKSSMPLVHFGDTSYEKYIFGGQGKLPPDVANKPALLPDKPPAIEDSTSSAKKYNGSGDSEPKPRERWDSPEKIRENGSSKELYCGDGGKHKGAHTTTVNFLSDESNSALAVPKVIEGYSSSGSSDRQIRLQFAASSRGLSPITCGSDDDEHGTVVSHTTKITVHLPPVISHHHHPGTVLLNANPFSNLKSVRLVMSILGQNMTGDGKELGPMGSLSLKQLFSKLYNNGEHDDGLLPVRGRNEEEDEETWSLRVREEGEEGEGAERILDRSRMIADKPSNSFPTTNHVVHKDVGSLSKRLPKKTPQIVSEDSDNNQVLLKIVTTHKPTLARVENDHSPPNPLKSRSKNQADDSQEEIAPTKQHPVDQEVGETTGSNSPSADLETKDHCDSSNGVDELVSDDEAPTYENIFDAVGNGDPVYENFQVAKSEPATKDKKVTGETIAAKKRQTADKVSTNSCDRRHKKVSAKLSNGSNAEESLEKIKVKPDRVKTAISSLSSAKSDKNSLRSVEDHPELKQTNKVGSRLSNSRDNSIKRYKDTKLAKDDNARGTQAKRKNSSKINPAVQEHKSTPSSIGSEKNAGTIRSKKPVEVVYQTAVFNMKNEKLSKPAKAKEIKGPRLINDLICGSKLRRPSDGKKIIKTAIVSQNTSKRKETPTTMSKQ